MSDPVFSFIFVNYRSARCLEVALQSLKSPLFDLPHELIIVNNDLSEAAQIDVIGAECGAIVRQLSGNFGFGRANNEGAKIARGKILCFLNPDTRWESGNFRSVEAGLASHPGAILGLRLLTPAKAIEPWSCGARPTLGELLQRKLVPSLRRNVRGHQVLSVEWVSGAALALSAETFSSLNGFDDQFFLYYEDVDLCVRAGEKGWPVIFYPFVSFVHDRGQSHDSYQSMKNHYFAGQRRYFEKHGRQFERWLLALLQPLYRRLFS